MFLFYVFDYIPFFFFFFPSFTCLCCFDLLRVSQTSRFRRGLNVPPYTICKSYYNVEGSFIILLTMNISVKTGVDYNFRIWSTWLYVYIISLYLLLVWQVICHFLWFYLTLINLQLRTFIQVNVLERHLSTFQCSVLGNFRPLYSFNRVMNRVLSLCYLSYIVFNYDVYICSLTLHRSQLLLYNLLKILRIKLSFTFLKENGCPMSNHKFKRPGPLSFIPRFRYETVNDRSPELV